MMCLGVVPGSSCVSLELVTGLKSFSGTFKCLKLLLYTSFTYNHWTLKPPRHLFLSVQGASSFTSDASIRGETISAIPQNRPEALTLKNKKILSLEYRVWYALLSLLFPKAVDDHILFRKLVSTSFSLNDLMTKKRESWGTSHNCVGLLSSPAEYVVKDSHSGPVHYSTMYVQTSSMKSSSQPGGAEHGQPRQLSDLNTAVSIATQRYCISPVSGISPPFQCDNDCDSFHGIEVVHQWSSEGRLPLRGPSQSLLETSGYMALWHEQLMILIVLRGTRSFKDTLTDLNTEMVAYQESPSTCVNCKVHKGFYMSYLLTWDGIKTHIDYYTQLYPDYEVRVMGHSLGGAISVFIGLKLALLDDSKDIKVVTMGQPMVGNPQFAQFIDSTFKLDLDEPFIEGSILRITHRNDPVVKLPMYDNRNWLSGSQFEHSDNI
ncbi:Feruloyl esterase A; AltName: Full=Ferulic acid esterase A; AltName: Full=FAE-III; AltName: Full=Cinnamoyl esterase; Flags: Precursor [Cyberlindnera jadinii]|uniref:triacylglycerol lipase n=1 Tax=Cyberlindnera jadinii (strain ATCC 18201 / CBS 1600 / BCRC 20928 / JCM 3617 / NBRC 0987 / NRRL Y-1542) TaxID=983966 RepID=A0A0H5C7F1_CYBJN|nr:Feruloyl esterase A; AltName: Full=Ferulic acid esterase A; AltName: Full=FAE-III; AltName: Full=Cinnamoyl esterase; Flags: Precursor [Cyberlindnera jadinii]